MESETITSREILIYLSLIHEGEWLKIVDHIHSRQEIDVATAKRAVASLRYNCLTYLDPDYPAFLQTVARPPLVIYYDGDISLLANPSRLIGVCGSKELDPETDSLLREIVKGLAKDERVTVISGLIKGTQEITMNVALEYGKPVACLPCGIDMYDPPSKTELIRAAKKKGLAISIFPPGTKASPIRVLQSNWLMAQLSHLLFVSSAFPHEGVLETVALTLNKGGDVACLPFRANEGNLNNVFISDGAALVSSSDDILFQMGITNS